MSTPPRKKGFQSDDQRKAVMALLRKARKGKRVVYHGTVDGLRKIKPDMIMHVGDKKTAMAALQRQLDEIEDGVKLPNRGGDVITHAYLYELELDNVPLFSTTKSRTAPKKFKKLPRMKRVYDEKRLDPYGKGPEDLDRLDELFGEGEYKYDQMHDHYGLSAAKHKVIDRLRKRGYTTVPYVNNWENKGNLSFGVIDPKKALKIRKRTKIKLKKPVKVDPGWY